MKTLKIEFIALLGLLLAGCGEPEQQWHAAPEGWPDSLAGRNLYATSNAYIYATNSSAAREIHAVVAAAGKEFENRTKRTPPVAVVLVTDDGDPPPLEDTRILFIALALSEAHRKGEAEPGADRLDQQWYALSKAKEQEQVPVDIFLMTEPLALESEVAARYWDLPTDALGQDGRVFLMPTKRCISRGVDGIFMAALKKARPAERILVAPVMAMAKPFAMEEMGKEREEPIFAAFVETSSELPDTKKRDILAAYYQQREKDTKNKAARIGSVVP